MHCVAVDYTGVINTRKTKMDEGYAAGRWSWTEDGGGATRREKERGGLMDGWMEDG